MRNLLFMLKRQSKKIVTYDSKANGMEKKSNKKKKIKFKKLKEARRKVSQRG